MHVNPLNYAYRFARFCKEHEVDPYQLRIVIKAIEKAIRANIRHCNQGTEASGKKFDRAAQQMAEEVARLGIALRIEWPGLCPYFSRSNGAQIEFPLPS